MQDESKITIGFKYIDRFKNKYESESEFEIFEDLGDDELTEMGMYFNTFLKQAGYMRHNDLIFMEDITEEECDALHDFLDEYRAKQKEEQIKQEAINK